jgi:hypothetical protein
MRVSLLHMREWFTALATPLIAIIGLCIACQQHRLQRYQLKKDLFEKRWKVYLAVIQLLKSSLPSKIEIEVLDQFNLDTLPASFLFGNEVDHYLENLRQSYIRMSEISEDKAEPDFDSNENKKILNEELRNRRKWMREQFIESREVFKKYLWFDI